MLGFSQRSRKVSPWVATIDKNTKSAVSVPARDIKASAGRTKNKKTNTCTDEIHRAQAMLDFVGDAVISTDIEANITYMNRAAEIMTGFSRQEAVGRALADVFHVRDIRTREPRANLAQQVMGTNCGVALHNSAFLVTLAGQEVPIEDSATPLHNKQGEVVGSLVMFHDARYSYETTARMTYLAQHDPLTGLLNRHAFAERFEQAAGLAQRHRKKMVILFIDLDNFKEVNDSLGHSHGDLILKSLGRKLMGCVRVTDHVCRLGGDEFAVLLSDIDRPEQAFSVVDKMRETAADLLQVEGLDISLGLSIGASVYPDNGESLEKLVAHADAAMYQVKASHKIGGKAPPRNRSLDA